jgi:hypothetical protein
MVLLMKEVFAMFNQKNLPSLHSATSSLELAVGATHCGSRTGPIVDLFGQVHPRVNHSALREKEKEKTTCATYGPYSSISSANADLQQFLESRLQHQLEKVGSTIYKQTWQKKTTPAQWLYCQRVASVLRTSATDFSSWPTPSATDYKGGYQGGRIRNGKLSVDRLDVAVQLTPWATPNAWDASRGPVKGGLDESGQRVSKDGVRYGRTLVTEAHMVLEPSTAKTESTAPSQLNPRFSLWLMGYPIEWAYCGERVMQSSRKSPRK